MFVLLIVTLFLLFLKLFHVLFVKRFQYWKEKNILQPPSTWVLENSLKLVFRKESFAESLIRIYKKFPKARYFGTYQFTTPIFVVRDTDLIKRITIKDFEHFVDHREFIPESADPLWGSNLFALKGQRWKDMRIVLSPAFTSSKMKTMFNVMKETAENFVGHIEDKQQNTIELNTKNFMQRYTCDVIASTAYGIKVDSLKSPKNEFYEAGIEFNDFSGWRFFLLFTLFILPKWIVKTFKVQIFNKKVTNFFTNIVEETINIREEKGIMRPDMIHLLMEARKGRHNYEEENVIDTGFATAVTSSCLDRNKNPPVTISKRDIAAQASIFFFGGFDTVSIQMGFLVYELAVNSYVQTKLRNEINKTYTKYQGNITYEALMEMNYMDMVVTESLRKWPNALMLERICTKTYTIPALHPEENDVTIETGTMIWIPIIGLHYDSQYYVDPEKFYPERFNDDNKNKINPAAYIPFGAGPRNCIGSRYAIMKIKIMFFYLLKSFQIIPVEKSIIPMKFSRTNFLLDGESFWFGFRRLDPTTTTKN